MSTKGAGDGGHPSSVTPHDSYSNACGHCGKRPTNTIATALLLCGGCRSEHYCDFVCQKAAWKAGHKAECKRRQAEVAELTSASAQAARRQAFEQFCSTLPAVDLRNSEMAAKATAALAANFPDVPTPEQPPLVPGGLVIRAGGGRNWKYKLDDLGIASPLNDAIRAGKPLVVKQLLERGEDLHARTRLGVAPLAAAVGFILGTPPEKVAPATTLAQCECMDMLLAFGADPNAQPEVHRLLLRAEREWNAKQTRQNSKQV